MIHTLTLDGTSLEFGLRKILSDVYLKCESGKITGLLGRNGEGKSCLMNIISGNVKPLCSSIRIDGHSVVSTQAKPELILHLPQFNFIPKSLRVNMVLEDFELELADFANWFPEIDPGLKVAQLSGGQRRTLEIYVIAQKKSMFAMLDEPFTHLNPIQIEKIKRFLVSRKTFKGLLISDHLYQHVFDISDTIYLLKNGKVHLVDNIQTIAELEYIQSIN